jgi:hypothetical protein
VLLPVQALALTRLADGLPPAHPSSIRTSPCGSVAAPDRPAAEVPRARTHRLVLTATVLGGASGAAVIVSALLDPAPPPDWTLPRPHHLTASGIWHARFLVGASGLFARLWADLLLRLRALRDRPPQASGPQHRLRRTGTPRDLRRQLHGRWFPTAVCAGAGYAGYAVLAVHDGWRSASAPADLSYPPAGRANREP